MDPKQRAHILKSLFKIPIDEIGDKLILELKFIIDRSDDAEILKPKLLDLLINGINNLNLNQFNNILHQINESSISDSEILIKLKFYEVKEEFHINILTFFQDYKSTLKPINVEKLDINFKGLQVATRDDFNKILIDGYTGDWVVSPANIYPLRIQIASMNETGNYPRGYFINADIDRIDEVYWGQQLRHRIFIKNAKIINSGNSNIKFNMNPVSYIR